jgi:hypothetical protein
MSCGLKIRCRCGDFAGPGFSGPLQRSRPRASVRYVYFAALECLDRFSLFVEPVSIRKMSLQASLASTFIHYENDDILLNTVCPIVTELYTRRQPAILNVHDSRSAGPEFSGHETQIRGTPGKLLGKMLGILPGVPLYVAAQVGTVSLNERQLDRAGMDVNNIKRMIQCMPTSEPAEFSSD